MMENNYLQKKEYSLYENVLKKKCNTNIEKEKKKKNKSSRN